MEKTVVSIHVGRPQQFEVTGEPAKTWKSAMTISFIPSKPTMRFAIIPHWTKPIQR